MDRDVDRFGQDLTDEDLAKIIQVNQEEESTVSAFKELIRRRSPLLKQVIQHVLGDPQQSTTAKSSAAIALGKGRVRGAPDILMKYLDARNPQVFERMVRALGWTGRKAALQQLEQLGELKDPLAQRELNFARSLLSYRLRLDRHQLPVPSEEDLAKMEGGEEIKVLQVRPKVFAKAARDVREDLPGVRLSDTAAVHLLCQSNELVLAFTKDFEDFVSLQSLRKRSALPLVLLKKAYSLERYALDALFFTHPLDEKDEVALLGTRPSGALIYAGRVGFSGQQIVFRLRSLVTRYAPAVEVEGFYDPELQSLEITRAFSGQHLAQAARPGFPKRAAAMELVK